MSEGSIRRGIWSGLLGTLALTAFAADSGPPPWITLDPQGGAIDGRMAMAFLPVDIEAGPADPYTYFLDPKGCTAHYVLKDDLDTEEVYPCDTWVQPSTGRYFAWIEQGWQRTPFVVHGVYSASPSRKGGRVSSMELAPAGRVALAEAIPGHSLHVLHVDGHLNGEFPQREIFRRVPESNQEEGALFPEGSFVAFLFDPTTDEYVWVTQPSTVAAEKVTTISSLKPPEKTALLVSVIRAKPIADYEKLAIDIRAGPPGEERPPDVRVPGVYHYHALWYGLDGKFARVVAETDGEYLVPVDVPLRPGKVEAITEELRPKPNLEAVLDLPVELPAASRTLEVFRPSDSEPIRTAELSPEVERHVVSALPAEDLRVSLQSPPWTLTEAVDLRDGLDQSVTFAPQPILLEGTVYFGDRRHPASIVFTTNRAHDELQVETDEEGRYETVLFRPGVYLIRVQLAGRNDPGFLVMTDHEPITESRELDFFLPGNRFEVEVTDQSTGEPIEGAQVSCHNKADEGPTVALQAESDAEGRAALPPLRPGTLKLGIDADGYLPQEVEVGRVEEHDRERSVPVSLEPEGQRRTLLVTLADGRLAAYAEVREQMTIAGPSPWRSAADASGRLEVPDAVRGSTLLVRHPDAAFAVRSWQPGFEELVSWQLPPAQPPLSVQVVESWGDPAAFARVALKIEGRWWSGPELAWLTRSRTAASRSGQWSAEQLPQVPLELVAWSRESATNGLAPLESAAVTVPWPRASSPIEIQVLP